MSINDYFKIIQDKIKNKDFKILKINCLPEKSISVFLASINYMMWEWNDDHKDKRNYIFDFIIIPNNVDFDFTSISFEDFIKFLSSEKSKEIEMVDIEGIDIITEQLDSFWC